MKATGITRRIDELGRVVIPVELRRTLGMEIRDALEIFVEDEKIIFQKYLPACIFCGSTEDLKEYKGKNVCKECRKSLR